MATLYRPNEPPRPVSPAEGETFTLKELQAHVGGYVEIHPTRPMGAGDMILVDEEGGPMLKGLPPNVAASALVGSTVFGPALLLSRREMGD